MLPWYEWEKTVRLTGRKAEEPFEIHDDISKSYCITMKPEVLQYFAAKNPDQPQVTPLSTGTKKLSPLMRIQVQSLRQARDTGETRD